MSAGPALAVLGDPLAYTRSPELHRAGFEWLGLSGRSEALRTAPAQLEARLHELVGRGFLGVNLTSPLKEAALPLLQRVSEPARRSRSVNTIGFASDGWWGETTDGIGFVDLLGTLGRDPAGERVVFLGAGGAARSLALALSEAGADAVVAAARNVVGARDAWGEIDARVVEWGSRDLTSAWEAATLVVHAVPGEAETKVDFTRLSTRTLCIDLAYGPSPTRWALAARAAGREAYDGLGLLVFQARRSMTLWFSRPVPVDPLARAVGWPR